LEKQAVLKALLDIYLYSDLDDTEELNNYLKNNDIDFDEFSNSVLDKLQRKKAELKIEEGRRFRKNFLKLLQESIDKKQMDNLIDDNFAMAYRKKADAPSGADNSEAKMMELIKKAKTKS